MRIFAWICVVYLSCLVTSIYAKRKVLPAITAEIPLNEIHDYQEYPTAVKDLIGKAYHLSRKNLTYLYGSANPANHGMDCSGTIYYLLKNEGITDVPRDSSGMYAWAEKKGKLHRVNSHDFSSRDFNLLKPGDLLFWSGTYSIHRENAITHVMIYLGENKQGKRLMFGSSGGRTYQGKKMRGVSVFEFVLPRPRERAKFVGYSCFPQLTC